MSLTEGPLPTLQSAPPRSPEAHRAARAGRAGV